MKNSKRFSTSTLAPTPLALLTALALAATLLGCGPLGLGPAGNANSAENSASSVLDAVADNASDVALNLDGRAITVGEIDEYMKNAFLDELLREPPARIYEAREKAIREYVQRTVVESEAKKAGITKDELFEQTVSQAERPTAEEVATWFKQNEPRLRGAKLENVSGQIEEFLLNERRGAAWTAFIGPKIEALDYQLVLEPPREDLEMTRLVRGDKDAPVTIMAFSDYQCPYCIRAEPVLADVLSRFPGKVNVVHRHFPLDSIHPFARPAAEAAMCADEQGKFWEYHDAIFARNGQLSAEALDEIAGELSLDSASFGTCLSDGRYKQFVQDDFEAGQKAGVTGTPAFFVNGIMLKGSRDADQMSAIVESELERLN